MRCSSPGREEEEKDYEKRSWMCIRGEGGAKFARAIMMMTPVIQKDQRGDNHSQA